MPEKLTAYRHKGKERKNIPPVGLVTKSTEDEVKEKATYKYDPHLDPALDWAGKAEQPELKIDTRPLHVHERIDPLTIVEQLKKDPAKEQTSLFEEGKLPLNEAVEFYQHKEGWSNRLIAGDSNLIMNSLLVKEGLGAKVQMVYIDPPYGIKYGSNFQPFSNKRTVQDGKGEDLTTEPEMIRAFRDTWELGIHSYLSFMRDRLLLACELLTPSGSCFVQISDKNVHLVRCLMDEVFGLDNFVSLITYKVSTGASQALAPLRTHDYIIWYAKDKEQMKFHRLFLDKNWTPKEYRWVEDTEGKRRPMTTEERSYPERLARDLHLFSTKILYSKSGTDRTPREFEGKKYSPPTGGWRHSTAGFDRLVCAGRIIWDGTRLCSIRYQDDFPYVERTSNWTDTGPEIAKTYVVQTSQRPIERCMLMSTDPGDLVLDPTCGSGTTAWVAEKWGRRWITCDTSRIALALAKQRLMTSVFDYYKLADSDRGVGDGFKYEPVKRITMKSIANNPDIEEGMTRDEIQQAIIRHAPQETIYDRPLRERGKSRITGPFTVEAVPAPTVRSLDSLKAGTTKAAKQGADTSITRTGETQRQAEWRAMLEASGIRLKDGEKLELTNVELASEFQNIHARAKTQEKKPRRVLISFGPEHAPLTSQQVEAAWQEARIEGTDLLLFVAFAFDDEATKTIEKLDPEKAGMQLLKVQMDTDLLVGDLKKREKDSDSFWLVGQPDIQLHWSEQDGDPQMEVEVLGFDYYDPKNDKVIIGNKDQIAMWLLDTNYDDRSLFPRQIFFPMGGKNGWNKLEQSLGAFVDPDKVKAFAGTRSLPFPLPEEDCIAIKVIDDRGVESLRVRRGLKAEYETHQAQK